MMKAASLCENDAGNELEWWARDGLRWGRSVVVSDADIVDQKKERGKNAKKDRV